MASSKKPSIQFYPGDWRKDPNVMACSLAARGFWFEMLLAMHEAQPRGYLVTSAGVPFTEKMLSRIAGCSAAEVRRYLRELKEHGVYSVTEAGVIFSRRMKRDEHISKVRSDAGSNGGNPLLLKQKTGNLDNHNSDVLDNQSDGVLLNRLVHPRACAAEAEDEIEVEESKGVQGENEPPEPAVQVRRWLYEFMGQEWPEPDLILCEAVVRECGGNLVALQRFLQQLHNQRRKPQGSWAWFITATRRQFLERHR